MRFVRHTEPNFTARLDSVAGTSSLFDPTIEERTRAIVAEVDHTAPPPLRGYVIESVRRLMAAPLFDEALPGHLPPDHASQRRLPGLRRKLRAIAALA